MFAKISKECPLNHSRVKQSKHIMKMEDNFANMEEKSINMEEHFTFMEEHSKNHVFTAFLAFLG